MNLLELRVNGQPCTAPAEPRTHLADFLRDGLHLTGTHLGCEHGVCGACTVLMDGQPVRSCISFAVACQGREIVTVEGFDGDAVMRLLREAFTRHHALQCGFCTPGMLTAARDIVLRVPQADEARVRLELSGNLCRCTGYQGIVDAVLDVLEQQRREPDPQVVAARQALEQARGQTVVPSTLSSALSSTPSSSTSAAPASWASPAAIPSDASLPSAVPAAAPTQPEPTLEALDPDKAQLLEDAFDLAFPAQAVWDFMGDLQAVAACLPGATVESEEDDRVKGRVEVRFGPMTAAFRGAARLERHPQDRSALLRGAGQDSISRSRAQGDIRYRVEALSAEHTRVHVSMLYALQGPLAQFSRSGLVRDFVRRLVADFGREVEHRLDRGGGLAASTGSASGASRPPMGLFSLMMQQLLQSLRRLFRQPPRG